MVLQVAVQDIGQLTDIQDPLARAAVDLNGRRPRRYSTWPILTGRQITAIQMLGDVRFNDHAQHAQVRPS